MKLFRSLLLTSSAIAFEFTVWDQPDEDGKHLFLQISYFEKYMTFILDVQLNSKLHTYRYMKY